jgi:glutamate synthase domain-containing protein 3
MTANFDLGDAGVRDLNSALHNDDAVGQAFTVDNPGGKHNVAAGAMHECDIEIHGHVGYYCAGMNKNANIRINGNAGPGLAENMMSGSVRVSGNASQYCGATAHGGLLVIKGDAAARCGISMKGVDIVVGGSIGHMSAFMAQSGRLVVCGDAGDALGDSIYEARIYVRGEVASLGTDCIEKPMEKMHKKELEELLQTAGLDHDVGEFRRYGSARKLYNFQIDNASAY